jgi:pyroglutamyl-peptidase
MKTVLLSGFEPFDNDTINPSWEAVRQLDGEIVAGARVIALQLPCVFAKSLRVLEQAIKKHRPDVVIAVGQAGGRAAITPERVAINLKDARIGDNAGKQPTDAAIHKGGPAAYFSTLPVKAIAAALAQAGLPASVSHTAGTFVCNHVFYGLMALQPVYGVARCGFIHIPFLPAQAAQRGGAPSMALGDIVRGLRIATATSVRQKRDRRLVGGSTH